MDEQLDAINQSPEKVIIESEPKNTAPAILSSALFAFQKQPESILLVLSTDHHIENLSAFHNSVKLGIEQVNKNKIVIFGITPTHPETGYGYMELEANNLENNSTHKISSFVEKPNKLTAQNMVASGKYLWNAGIFMFKARDIIEAFQKFSPQTLNLVEKALQNAFFDNYFCNLDKHYWNEIEAISIDYLIMEKVKNLVSVHLTTNWSDLGNWNTVYSHFEKDSSGVVLLDNAHALDCTDTLLYSNGDKRHIVGLGLKNIIAVSMEDTVLVADKNSYQEVKKVVQLLKEKDIPQSEIYPRDHRPWGWFEVLEKSKNFQVKQINVKPGASLSLQSHKHRSEHWILVEGTAEVTINQESKIVSKNESVFIPFNAKHRLKNIGTKRLILIEVQIGTYFGEDDIVRYEDMYNRE